MILIQAIKKTHKKDINITERIDKAKQLYYLQKYKTNFKSITYKDKEFSN